MTRLSRSDRIRQTVNMEDGSPSSIPERKPDGKNTNQEATMKKIYSVPGIFGGEDYYDENGQQIGYSVPGMFGGKDFYTADGQPAGYSVDGIISGEDYYDESGDLRGYSVPGIFGGSDYYGADGKSAGWSTESLFGGENIHLSDDPFGSDPPDDAGSDEW